jgi:hypothetical protein
MAVSRSLQPTHSAREGRRALALGEEGERRRWRSSAVLSASPLAAARVACPQTARIQKEKPYPAKGQERLARLISAQPGCSGPSRGRYTAARLLRQRSV